MSDNQNSNPVGDPVITLARETPAQGEPTEYQSFEELAQKLVSVPKAEVDEKRKTS